MWILGDFRPLFRPQWQGAGAGSNVSITLRWEDEPFPCCLPRNAEEVIGVFVVFFLSFFLDRAIAAPVWTVGTYIPLIPICAVLSSGVSA